MTERYHALLIGIDNYPGHTPLKGCVNDVDAVQGLLLDGLGLSPDDIVRLDAPRPDTTHDTRVPREHATLANIEAALDQLASSRVAAGDRVFLYFSGHGYCRPRADGGRTMQQEALVPMDVMGDGFYRMLFDYQINHYLEAITKRTPSVSVVIDCCFGSGVTRGGDVGQIRCLELPRDARFETTRGAPAHAPLARRIDNCHVVTACLAYETSKELPDEHGVYAGVFTNAFIRAVRDSGCDSRALRWADIWQPMAAHAERLNPDQHAWMDGNAARAVFGGPPVERDPGLPVRYVDGAYHIAAGTLVDVTEDAVLAVYGPSTVHFPALGSEADLAARLGKLVVLSADRGTAIAQLHGDAFALPGDARARLVKPGIAARLRYDLEPADHAPPAMLDGLARSPMIDRHIGASVRLVHHARHWFVTDDLHGTGKTGDGRPVLFAIPDAEAAHARHVLEHYATYARPIAMARTLAGAGEVQIGGLEIRVLSRPTSTRDRIAAQSAGFDPAHGGLPALPETSPSSFDLTEGDEVAVAIYNTTDRNLRVALFDAAPSGKVYQLGDQAIRPGHHFVYWNGGNIDIPYTMNAPDGRRDAWIERVIAIGRSEPAGELSYLSIPTSLQDALEGGPAAPTQPELGRTGTAAHWTAAQAILTIRRR